MSIVRKTVIGTLLMIGVTGAATANLSRNNSFELFERLQLMEDKVQSLNGQLEVLNHQIQVLQQNQLAQFKDIDKRLTAVSSVGQTGHVAITASPSQTQEPVMRPTKAAAVTPAATADDASTSATADSASDRDAYHQAYNFIKEKRFPQASQAMSAFLKTYPSSHYAANAHYWMGELDLLAGDINAAIQDFEAIVTKHQNHSKVADAMLKLGYIYDDLGQSDKARQYLNGLNKQFPGSTASQLATSRINQMNRS